MTFSINSNPLALLNQKELSKSTNELNKTAKKLSSGKRLVDSSIDPAANQISAQKLTEENLHSVGIRNANDGISKLSIADASLDSASQITGRMAELAAQSANGTLSDEQRASLNNEYQELKSELDRINGTAEFNGESVFGETTLQTGTDGGADSQTKVQISGVSSSSLNLAATDISTQAGAQAALDSTKSAIDSISNNRAEIGAAESRIATVIENNRSTQIATASARSLIEDADMAQETSNYTALKIKQQINVSLNAHSFMQPENVLKLLQT